MHSEICPICSGKGKIKNSENTTYAEVTCHGCGGKGWIEISNGNLNIIPTPIYPSSPYTPYVPDIPGTARPYIIWPTYHFICKTEV